MRKLFILCSLIIISTTASAADKAKTEQKSWSPDWDKWAVCETAQDCAVVLGTCGTLEAINEKYLEDHKAYLNYARERVRCATPDKDHTPDKVPAVCVAHKCALLSS